MAKKKKKNTSPEITPAVDSVDSVEVQKTETVEESSPKFEIGQKGDEFDISYSRAVRNANADADELLNDLSQEQGADRYNFIGVAIPILVLLFFALSFILINRSDFSEVFTAKLSTETVMDGSYLENLTYAYNTTLPFGDGLSDIGEFLGFAPKSEDEEEAEEDEWDSLVEVQEPEVTEPVVTTAPTTTEPVTTATTETVEEEVPDTYVMYATGTVNIRLEPSSDSMMLGYFSVNNEVDVIEIRDDGWAEIYYSGVHAYVDAEYLSDARVVVTTTTEATTEVTTTTEETEEVTTTPEVTTEATTETTTEATTTTTRITTYYPDINYTTPATTTTQATTTTEPTTEATTEATTEPTTSETITAVTTTEPDVTTEAPVTTSVEITTQPVEVPEAGAAE